MIRLALFVGIALTAALGTYSRKADGNSSKATPFHISDPVLRIELIAEQPDIVTPIGMAFDGRDDLYVLESHTHSPPSDYAGPAFDRIKKGIDENGDGKPDQWVVFADSIENGINLDIDEAGTVYLTTKKSLLAFRDLNNDGISDERRTLLTMPRPDYVYDHAGLLGVALGRDGWVYVSRGNLGSKAWRIEGTDSSFVEGYGDGGVVIRCQRDGSRLEQVASGFWNPFDLKFLQNGRLLMTDNDPDSRGPNRLIELVPGGDYGFKSLYGGNGLHPYVAWNGELPGTLPFAAALGEAPCALIDAGYTNFSDDYRGTVLVNVWEENTIVRIPLQKQQSTVAGSAEVLVQGDSSFHPVALATNSRGDLYISDWVLRQYPNHGKGKIWRLSAENDTPISRREPAPERTNRFADESQSTGELIEVLRSGDVFRQAMARRQLAGSRHRKEMLHLIDGDDPVLRLQALLTLQQAKVPIDRVRLEKLLTDPDQRLRRATLIYIGSMLRTDLTEGLQQALSAGAIGPELFDTYLATVQHLQPAFIENYNSRSGIAADKIEPRLPESYIATIISDSSIPEGTRALALPYLEAPQSHRDLLLSLLRDSDNSDFSVGLIKALKLSVDEEVGRAMINIALDETAGPALRAQAVLKLSQHPTNYCAEMQKLLTEDSYLLQYSALKYLCRCSTDPSSRSEVANWVATTANEGLRAVWNKCTGPASDQPGTPEQWSKAVNDQGNAAVGRLVFELIQSQCQSCHRIDGWGGTYGPNLSGIGSSKSKTQMANAVLQPSREISPEWQGWFVVDQQGVKHLGRQIDVNSTFTELLNQAGEFDRYENPRSFGVLEESLMPAGLQYTMTPEEFNHLIAYLASLK